MEKSLADPPRPTLCRPHRFEFEFDQKYLAPLAAFGVLPGKSWIDVDEDEIEVRFGIYRMRTRRTNIAHVKLTGPYRWWRAIGMRLSLADKGATFGSNTRGGVCIAFHNPVGILPGGRLRCPALTVTPADRLGLERALSDAPF